MIDQVQIEADSRNKMIDMLLQISSEFKKYSSKKLLKENLIMDMKNIYHDSNVKFADLFLTE